MISAKAFATLERLVELRRQRAAMSLGRLKQDLNQLEEASRQARIDANPQPEQGALPAEHFASLALLQKWEFAHQHHITTARGKLLQAVPAAEQRLRRARATVQAMDLLGERVARAEKIKQMRKEEISAAAEAANRPDEGISS